MKILVVDDNLENIDLMLILLRSRNYEVDSAVNGQEGLNKLRSDNFDLIISDILMPVMDGFRFCKECKKDEKLKDILFVFYTATYVDKKDEDLALSLGAQKFIRKPQEPEVFLSLVQEVIENSDYNKPVAENLLHDEKEVLKLYSERLVKKLEKKNLDLEREIIHRKKIEEELVIAKEKAEESDRLKTAFLANISHEIRTPLNGLLGFASLLSPEMPEEKLKEYIEIIKNSGDQLLKIIWDILEISKIETLRMVIEEKVFDLEQFIKEVYIVHYELHRFKKPEIEFKLNLNSNLKECKIIGDKPKLKQIISNLLENAFKFTHEGTISLSCEIKDNLLCVSIKDTGIGIPKESLHIIFDNFTQAHDKISQLYGGTGLGLSISKNLIKLMGGKIDVSSELGVGSEFKFEIPVKVPEIGHDKKKLSSTESIIDLKGTEIIVAEDDDVNFQLMENYLNAANCTVYHAGDGSEVMELLDKHPNIKLILMDIRMPVMDGVEAIKLLRSKNISIPVIAQTAYIFEYKESALLNVGFNDYIPKPIEKMNLLSLLSRHIYQQ